MTQTALGGAPATLVGDLPTVGSTAPEFTLTGTDLADLTRDASRRTVLNIFPSVDTGVCAASVRQFNKLAAGLPETDVVNVAMDLPFAMGRFCGSEGIENVIVGSAFRSSFGEDYGVTLTDSGFRGLFARAVVVLDRDGTVLHSQLVPEIGDEPDYDSAIASLS
ncbi:thiol peroxidase [Aeromicrobium sp. CF3.5]|uniref:thiol peroxidase n=1 Tax=Aeromicrobium sp. CF3.5 TaxID=3373078 RepID=UPI003EE71B57